MGEGREREQRRMIRRGKRAQRTVDEIGSEGGAVSRCGRAGTPPAGGGQSLRVTPHKRVEESGCAAQSREDEARQRRVALARLHCPIRGRAHAQQRGGWQEAARPRGGRGSRGVLAGVAATPRELPAADKQADSIEHAIDEEKATYHS